MRKISGTGLALVTPFKKNLSVDYDSLKKIIAQTQEVDYYLVNGTTSESPTTSNKEKREILDFIKKNNSTNKPIVYCISSNSTDEILQKTREIDVENVFAFLITSPFYNKPSQKGILEHYTKIADQSPLPILLYNAPHRTSSNIEANTTIALSHHDNIIGIKECSGNLLQCVEIMKYKNQNFLLLSGDDILAVSMISIGGAGLISVLANCMAKEITLMVKNALNGDFKEANKYLLEIFEPTQTISKYGNPVGTKIIMHQKEFCEKYVRLPLSTID